MSVSRLRIPSPSLTVQDFARVLPFHLDDACEDSHVFPGYTISRAILSDAFALTRGDRFYTQDFTPYNMTAWGFADCQRDAEGYGFGSTLGRLFLRTLPNDYSVDSIYTWFPLVQPESMEGYLKALGKLDGYSVARPKPRRTAATVDNYVEVGQVLRSTDKFIPESAERAAGIIKGKKYVGTLPLWVVLTG